MTTRNLPRSTRSAVRLLKLGGLLFAGVGAAAWGVVTSQLRAERITVPDDADMLPGRPVQGPITAFAQAAVIQRNAERGTDGRTFADISEALKHVEHGSDEEKKLRGQSAALSTAASLRTSLMTSVLAYGVSAFAGGLGALMLLMSRGIRRGAKKDARA